MKKHWLVVIAAALLTITGCASSGNQSLKNETVESVNSKIIQGKTSKDEVRTMFGDPSKTSFTDGGNEVWDYELADVSGDAVNYIPIVNMFGSSTSGTKKQLVVMFKDNVVYRFSMSDSPYAVKTGLFK